METVKLLEMSTLIFAGIVLCVAIYGLYFMVTTTIVLNKINNRYEEKLQESLNNFYISPDSPLKKQIDKVFDENPEFREDIQARIEALK